MKMITLLNQKPPGSEKITLAWNLIACFALGGSESNSARQTEMVCLRHYRFVVTLQSVFTTTGGDC